MACISACHQCASACLEESPEQFAICIRQNMKCGTICFATIQMITLGSEQVDELCTICAEICNACAAECASHHTEMTLLCARSCLKCADACHKLHSAQGLKFWMLN
ncbi:MAG TPA: four-helix bundle copper-binding protein [Bacteroidia bacterium]|nr:four-helix bundle copper-binding protein [Bacteroidia bacterium]